MILQLPLRSCCLLALGLASCFAANARGSILGFVANPGGNSIDFANYVSGIGAYSNSSIDFNGHPNGPLLPAFYVPSVGVTLMRRLLSAVA